MRFGIVINAGDPREMAQLAADAEAAGWDGVFYYDAIAIDDTELYDPWIVLAAFAMRTERATLGLIVTPPSRRRPWKLAREAMTLDVLSNGRLVLPVGLGALDDRGFANVGEPTEARTRAELLDESLAILDGLWSGEPFAFEGRHHRFGPMRFVPQPVQRPRIPIWVVAIASSERSMARALRWDGIVTQTEDPLAIRRIADRAARERGAEGRPFDVVVQGRTTGATDEAREQVRPFVEAGVTWWIDADWADPTFDSIRRRIVSGPPRVP